MSKSPYSDWNSIFENLVMLDQPPVKYILEAFVTTKTGSTYNMSGQEFLDLWTRELQKDEDSTLLVDCKVRLDYPRIKRDVNRWANQLIKTVESEQQSK